MKREVNHILPALALTATGLIALSIGLSRALYPFDTGHYEGGVWSPASIAFAGHNPFHLKLTNEAPFVMAPYGPFYYWLIGLGLSLFGLQFWFGRAVSIVSTVVVVLCVGKIVHHLTKCKDLALLGCAIFLSLFPLQAWIGIQRPDLLALAFSSAGLMLVILGTRVRPHLVDLAAASFFSLALMSRQTALLPVLIGAFWCWRESGYRRAGLLLATVATLVGAACLGLNSTSNGGFFWQAVVLQSGVELSLANTRAQVTALAKLPATWVVSFCLMWLAIRIWKTPRRAASESANPEITFAEANWKMYRGFGSISVYLVLAVALAAVTGARRGANVNYWLEVSMVVALIVPIGWKTAAVGSHAGFTRFIGIVSLLLMLSAGFSGARCLRGEYFRWKALAYYEETVRTIGTTSSEALPLFSVYPELVTYARRKYYFNDFCQYDGRSAIHAQLLKDAIRDGKFGAIVTHSADAPRGYHLVPMAAPIPKKFYVVYLHVRDH